ncbi:MAG: response regulator [Candidatus Omnitrophota bacterium]
MKKMILIADDELDALVILEKRLKANDYEVKTAASGKEVIEMVKTCQPDLLLLDIAMSDLDGYSVAQALKQNKSSCPIPIIFITGKELLPNGIETRIDNLGACDYIMKPCSFEDILAKIKKAIH